MTYNQTTFGRLRDGKRVELLPSQTIENYKEIWTGPETFRVKRVNGETVVLTDNKEREITVHASIVNERMSVGS